MAKGKNAPKADDDAEPKEKGPGMMARLTSGVDSRGKDTYVEPDDMQKALLTRMLEARRKEVAARDPNDDEVFYQGGGFMKKFRVSRRTIKSSRLVGGYNTIMGGVVLAMVFGVIGLIIDVGIAGDIQVPKYHVWAIGFVFGGCCGSLFTCLCVTCKRAVQSLETRLITDIELRQSFLQNCRKVKKAKIMVWSYDPSTPQLLIKVLNPDEVFQRLRDEIDANRAGVDELIEEVTIHKRRYGMQKKWLGAGICGMWGILPTRAYDITSRKLDIEETKCTKRVKSSGSMSRVYDIVGYQDIFQVVPPLVVPCLVNKVGFFSTGYIKLYSFDRNALPVKIKVQKMLEVFDGIREFIDAKNACTFYWAQAKTMGIIKSFITGDPQTVAARHFTLVPIDK